MAALRASIKVTAQSGCATALNGTSWFFVPGGGRGGPCMGRQCRWGSKDEKNGFNRGPWM